MAPLYDFECEKGHVTERLFRMDDVKSTDCSTCGGPTRRIFSRAAVVDDFPEHMNISLGRVVKSRAHLKQLQKELGCQDWVPPPQERPLSSKMRREGLL